MNSVKSKTYLACKTFAADNCLHDARLLQNFRCSVICECRFKLIEKCTYVTPASCGVSWLPVIFIFDVSTYVVMQKKLYYRNVSVRSGYVQLKQQIFICFVDSPAKYLQGWLLGRRISPNLRSRSPASVNRQAFAFRCALESRR